MQYLEFIIQTIIVFPLIPAIILFIYLKKDAFKYVSILFLISNILLLLYITNMWISLVINLLICIAVFMYSKIILTKKYKKGTHKYLFKNIVKLYTMISMPINLVLLFSAVFLKG